MLFDGAVVAACTRGERQRGGKLPWFDLIRAAVALLMVASVTLIPIAASAVELPPAGNAYWIQTNGPNAAVGLGDWYTSNTAGAGAGYHYVEFQVPCGWPAGLPIFVDLFSAEENRVAEALAQHEEPNGNYDSTQFELYGPGATVGRGSPALRPAPGSPEPRSPTSRGPRASRRRGLGSRP